MKKENTRKEFQVPSKLSEVQAASERVLAFLGPLRLSEALRFDIRLCLEEALINAMKYGNRLEETRPVQMSVEVGGGEIRIRVTDQGPGFDVCKFRDCTREENLYKTSGRGIYLMHHLMDRVEYNAKGNSVLMVKSVKHNGGTGE